MSAITIDDDLVHYEVLGRGRPVILIHGWLGSWRYWVPTMQQLAVKYRCYALDLWGFGDSAKDPNRYSISRQVDLIDQFIQRMGIPKIVMVGHGLGAVLAARFASDPKTASKVHRMLVISPPLFEGAPSRNQPVRALTANSADNSGKLLPDLPQRLTDTQARPPALTGVPSESDALTLLKEIRQQEQPATLSANPVKDAFGQTSLDDLLKRALPADSEDYPKLKAEMFKADPQAINKTVDALSDVNTLRDIMRTQAATCAIIGASDGLMPAPREAVLQQLDEREALKLVVMPGTYHYPMLEDNSQFVRLLKEFLEAPDLSSLEIKEEWRRRKR